MQWIPWNDSLLLRRFALSIFRSSLKDRKWRNIAIASAALAVVLVGCTSVPPKSGSAPGHTEACKATNEQEIAALFDRWNRSLQTGDPHAVVANYAARSILLPTVSNKPRLTEAEKEDYFHHFLESSPGGGSI